MKKQYSPIIDVFTHILPGKYDEGLTKKSKTTVHKERKAGCSALFTLDDRFRIMDKLGVTSQVLTVVQPPIESVVGPKDAVELSKLANDEMAELVAKYPDRFVGAVACLPMSDIDAALKEAERTIRELKFKGVQLFTPINGRPVDMPELMGLYDMMSKFNLPIWFHPNRERSVPDYISENESKYDIARVLGWPYDTSVGMARLVFSGVFEKYPNLKFIVHHCGAMIPFFAARISGLQPAKWLKEPVEEYFKKFYVDTALRGSVPALMCGHAFFGAEHMLYGTDMPREGSLKENMESIEMMDIPDASKKKIFSDNAKQLLRLPN